MAPKVHQQKLKDLLSNVRSGQNRILRANQVQRLLELCDLAYGAEYTIRALDEVEAEHKRYIAKLLQSDGLLVR